MWLILNMETYCVKKRKNKCVSGSDQIIKAKNNRLILRCICANCHIVKSNFIKSNKIGGLLDLHSVIGKLPQPKGGFTLQVISILVPIIPWTSS